MLRIHQLAILLLCSALPAIAHTFAFDTVAATAGVDYDHARAAIDSQGHLGLCYQNSSAGDVLYAHHNGAAWTTEVVESAGDVGAHCSVVFDANDAPHLVYYDMTNNRLRHATKNGAWTLRTVDAATTADIFTEYRLSVAISAHGTLGVAYYDRANSELRYATFAAGNWTHNAVVSAGDAGRYPALAYDGNGHPAIVYMQYVNAAASTTQWIAHDGTTWSAPVTLDATERSGAWNVLQFDAQNVPHVAYQTGILYGNQYYYELRYLRRDAGAWSAAQTISSQSPVDAGGFANMAIGTDNVVQIAYRNYFRSALFGSANYLQLYSLYFPQLGADRTATMSAYVAVSAAPAYDMRSISVATRGTQLVIAYVQDTMNRDYAVKVAQVASWSPVIATQRPDAAHHTATTSFDVQWLDHDPDSAATIRWYARNSNWEYTLLADGISENDQANQATLNVAALAPGDYSLEARISDDAFASYHGYAAPTALTIEAPVVVAPPAPDPEPAPVDAPAPVAAPVDAPAPAPEPVAAPVDAPAPQAPVADAPADAPAQQPAPAPANPASQPVIAGATATATTATTTTSSGTSAGAAATSGAKGGCSLIVE